MARYWRAADRDDALLQRLAPTLRFITRGSRPDAQRALSVRVTDGLV